MVFVFDIDETIWDSVIDIEGDYKITNYYESMIEAILDLYEKGHIIILQTARHWDKFKQTKEELCVSGVKYHSLVMGNVPADYYINDKGITPYGFLELYKAHFKKEETNG